MNGWINEHMDGIVKSLCSQVFLPVPPRKTILLWIKSLSKKGLWMPGVLPDALSSSGGQTTLPAPGFPPHGVVTGTLQNKWGNHVHLLGCYYRKMRNGKCWWGCGEVRTHTLRWWECKMAQLLWEKVRRLLKKFISTWPKNSTPGMHPKEPKAGAQTQTRTQMFIAALFIISLPLAKIKRRYLFLSA